MATPTTLAQVVQPTTQAAQFNTAFAAATAVGVPTSSWTGARNAFLAFYQVASLTLAGAYNALAGSIAGLFLDYAGAQPGMDAATAALAEAALTLFATSQYQLTRVLPQATVGYHTLTGSASGSAVNYAAGQFTDGTTGSNTASSRYYQNAEPGTLAPGTLSIPGQGQGITITSKTTGVNVSIGYSGSSSSLAFGVSVKNIAISLATDSAGNPTTTAAQLSTAIGLSGSVNPLIVAAVVGAGTLVMGAVAAVALDGGALVMLFSATQTGSAWNIPVGSTVAPKTGASLAGVSVALNAWTGGTWITSQGADLEAAGALKSRCLGRWGTIGVAGNAASYEFWARAVPNGYRVSPVASVQVLANYHSGGFYSNYATVVVVGPLGALSSPDLTAVAANFTGPVDSVASAGVPGLEALTLKFPLGGSVAVVTASNSTVTLTGTVSVYAQSGAALDDVRTAVTASITTYQRTMYTGIVLYPQKKIAGVIAQSSPFQSAISEVDLSGMSDSIAMTTLQYPIFDISGLVFQFVTA